MIVAFVTRVVRVLVPLAARTADNMNCNLMARCARQSYLIAQRATGNRLHQRRASDVRGH